MKNISVIGAGTMGNGIAHVFAMKGFKVNLIDLSQEVLDPFSKVQWSCRAIRANS